jgi:hypothetical protein
MDNLPEMNEEIGIVKWFGDSTKEGTQSNYGYIERIEKPDSSDIKVHWKGLSCSLDEIKWKKGLLVRFQIGIYRGKEEAINVKPIRVPGYVAWYGNFNQKINQLNEFGYVVIDTTVLIGKRALYIIAKNKNDKVGQNDISFKENIASLKYKKNLEYRDRVRINKEQLLCSESSLSANTAVCFGLEKNHRTNNYEALRLSLLEDEENQENLEIGTHSRNPIISQTAFRKYLTIIPKKEAISLVTQRCTNSSLRSKVLISTIPEKLLSLNEAKPLRDLLPLGQHLKLCLEMLCDKKQATNQDVLNELFSVATNVAKEERNSNHLYWKSIPESLLESKITYKGFLWSITPDYIKYKIAAKYLLTKPDIEAVEIANHTIINLSLEKDKIDFLDLLSYHLKSRLDARPLRELLPVESRLKTYHAMVAKYKANELIPHNVEEEIIDTLTNLPNTQIESWFDSNIEGKVIYKSFLWRIAPERVKRKIIEEKFDSFLSAIKTFNSGYRYEVNLTASAKDCYSNLDQKDRQLASRWISLENQNNQHILAQMLSARAAEKFTIKSDRITLPYLFLTLLSHFLDRLRFNDSSFHPQKYSELLYSEELESHPLGIYDPLNIIGELCETLSDLWKNRHQSRISEFKIFKFNGRGLLQGKRDSSEQLTTIIAYCGGFVEKKGKCGFTPLVLGKQNHCLNCGKLICRKCNYCSENCQQRLER